MAAPTVSSTSPIDGATNVSVQDKITIIFSAAIHKPSITPATVMVYRTDDTVPIYGAFTFSNSDKTVAFLPSNTLEENTSYTLKLVGSDPGTGLYIRAQTGEFLATTSTYVFRTGTERFVSLAEATTRDDLEQIGPIRETDSLAVQPTGGALEIERRTPKPFTTQVSVSATGFLIDFDQTIDSATVNATNIEVTHYPVLGMKQYWASVPTGESDPKLAVQQGGTLVPPNGTFAVGDDVVYWNIDAGFDFLYNTEVVVKVTTDLEGISDATLPAEVEYYFVTEYFPLFFDARLLRTELGPAVASLHDDTLNRIIHKNSIEGWELSGRAFSLVNPPYQAVKWTKCQSILDVLGVLMQTRDIAGNQSKTLGDFSVRYGPSDPELSAKYKEALKCVDAIHMGPASMIATPAVKGWQAPGERWEHKLRTWDHLLLQSIPGANLMSERSEKKRLSVEYAFDGKDSTFANTYFIRVVPTINNG